MSSKRLAFIASGGAAILASNLFAARDAWAASDFTFSPEQHINLQSLVFVTIASAAATSLSTSHYYWNSRLRDGVVFVRSMLTSSMIALLCFGVAFLPLLGFLNPTAAFMALYVPSLAISLLLTAFALWLRTVQNQGFFSYALAGEIPNELADEYGKFSKAMYFVRRDLRIARSKRRWARQQAKRELQIAAKAKKAAAKSAAKKKR